MPLFRLTLIISGKVQGVFFRESTCDVGKSLGIVGKVENLEDGTVRVIAEGPREKLEELKEWCKAGPEDAKIESIKEEWKEIDEPYYLEFSCIFH